MESEEGRRIESKWLKVHKQWMLSTAKNRLGPWCVGDGLRVTSGFLGVLGWARIAQRHRAHAVLHKETKLLHK